MRPAIKIRIVGDGVAARGCARLLDGRGFGLMLERSPRPKVPAIMIGRTTQGLFRDTFGQDDLFRGFPAITRRVVAWGTGSEVLTLPHSAVIAGEQDLLERLPPPTERADTTDADWTIAASRPLPEGCGEQHFGSRTARAVPVRLREDADRSACWVESMETGWLFLIPCGSDGGWLLEVGAPGEMLLPGSRLVSRQIAEAAGEPVAFPADPHIAWPLCGPGWLACGAAALSFDPLCGDGSGNAIREAILAAAVLRAIQRGGDAEALLAHYRWRLLAGFQRHLEVCEGFYGTGGSTPWWRAQHQAVRAGREWCARELAGIAIGRYRLRGFDLAEL
jgi:hypothetical protein